jgi:hypothetical protein
MSAFCGGRFVKVHCDRIGFGFFWDVVGGYGTDDGEKERVAMEG